MLPQNINRRVKITLLTFVLVSAWAWLLMHWFVEPSALRAELDAAGVTPDGRSRQLDEIILRYIPLGTSEKQIVAICSENHFKVFVGPHPGSDSPDWRTVTCTSKKGDWLRGADLEYRIIVEVIGGRAARVDTYYFLHGL